jgi:hypothetical protein
LSGDPTGALIRVDALGNKTTLLSDELTQPTGLAFARDGTLYIANNGFAGGTGQVLRVNTATAVPLPAGLAMLGGLGQSGGVFDGAGRGRWASRRAELKIHERATRETSSAGRIASCAPWQAGGSGGGLPWRGGSV